VGEYQYHCFYCDKKWGGIYRVNDPVCPKCGSEGDFYVKTYKIEHTGDAYGYDVEEEKLGKKQGYPLHRPNRD